MEYGPYEKRFTCLILLLRGSSCSVDGLLFFLPGLGLWPICPILYAYYLEKWIKAVTDAPNLNRLRGPADI